MRENPKTMNGMATDAESESSTQKQLRFIISVVLGSVSP